MPANAAVNGWHIRDDATGGECILIGGWDITSKTCTLSQDLSQGIIIDSDRVTFDGGGYTVTGTGTWGTGIYLFKRTGVIIKNLNVKNFTEGISLESSNNNSMINTIVNVNQTGIYLTNSNNNILTNNTALTNENGVGIILSSSKNNTLTDNTASNNGIGIFLIHSSNNTLEGNTTQENFYYDVLIDAYLESDCNNDITNTTGSGGRSIKYFSSAVNLIDEILSELILCNADGSSINNITIDGSATKKNNGLFLIKTDLSTVANVNSSNNIFGFYIDSSNDNTLTSNIISNNYFSGISLYSSRGNILTGNTINFNDNGGISMSISNNNILTNNTISDNQIGASFNEASDNQIYRNNFINNRIQSFVYDDSIDVFNLDIPMGGNYWSNFDTPAEGCTDTNNDGFCDASYVFTDGEHNLPWTKDKQDNLPWTKKDGWLAPSNQPPSFPFEIKQYLSDGITEITERNIIDNNAVILKAKVFDPDNDQVKIKASLYRFEEENNNVIDIIVKESVLVNSNEIASVIFDHLVEGDYIWRIQAIDEKDNKSGEALFGEQSLFKADFKFYKDFSFIHMTDVHIGSNMVLGSELFDEDWYEGLSYPRFTDALYEIEKLNPRPDFILIGGDNVEYAGSKDGIRWLEDFKSITDNFTERTGIKFYIVPGNHDRYERAAGEISGDFLSGGNDWLENYFKVIGKPKGVNLLFPSLTDFSTSSPQGYNRYNYYFNYKGIQFIGLDSGEDTGKGDRSPESTGLSSEVMESLAKRDPNIPKIIFMHHPVFTGAKDPDDKTDTGEMAEDGGITNNWKKFIKYSKDNKIEIVLSGHNHEFHIFNDIGNETSQYDTVRPLFIQTQSATKDNLVDKNGFKYEYKHGYRIVDVKKGKVVNSRVLATEFHSKIIADLDQNKERLVKFKAYEDPDPANSDSFFQNKDYNFSIPYFMANSSYRVIMHDYTNDLSRFSMTNLFQENDKYDLFVSKNEEDFTKSALDDLRVHWISGFKVKNSEYCKNPLSGEKCDGGFLVIHNTADKKINILKLKEMNIKSNSEDNLFINWPSLSSTSNGSSELPGTNLIVNGNSDTVFKKIRKKIIIDLHSPGELQVVDSTGRVSGLVNGKIKEEIPYSVYDEMNEAVVLFVDEGVKDNQYVYKVVGSDNATYGLSITKKEDYEGIENIISFDASNIPTDTNVVHQFSIDWDALVNGEKGVMLKIDSNGDGITEDTVQIGATLNDTLAPTTTPTISGTQGKNNWYTSGVAVTLTANDGNGIGVKSIKYLLDNSNWQTYTNTSSILITTEGNHTLQYFSTDFFGHQEATTTLTIKIDKTPPEAKIFFNQNLKQLNIEGVDNLSSVAVAQNDTIYTLTDEAGHTLAVDFNKLKTEGKEIKAEINAFHYDGILAPAIPENKLQYEWSLEKNGDIKELNQRIEIEKTFDAHARYDRKKNETAIDIKTEDEKDEEKTKQTFQGLTALILTTNSGNFDIKYNRPTD